MGTGVRNRRRVSKAYGLESKAAVSGVFFDSSRGPRWGKSRAEKNRFKERNH